MTMKVARFMLSEPPESTFSNQSNFFIDDKTTEFSALFRVLAGTCLITNLNSEDSVDADRNYFFGDFRKNESRDLSFLDNFEEGLILQDYEAHIKPQGYLNRKFYSNLLSELSGAVFNEYLEKHTSAFVHLYRAYEHLSYAFPMIYSAKTQNYVGTFEQLRNWMTNSGSDGNIGELRFHKAFIAALFHNHNEISSTVDISFICKDEYKEKIFDALAAKVLGWKNPNDYTGTSVRPEKLSIPFVEFHSFIVNLRNRYFHYSNARADNIILEEIVESDLLFSFVNKAGLNYIAIIFQQIVAHQIGR